MTEDNQWLFFGIAFVAASSLVAIAIFLGKIAKAVAICS